MSEKIVMFDTNTYINHYQGYKPIVDLFDQIIDDGCEIHMSAIVVMELMWFDKVETFPEIRKARMGYIDAADYVLDITEDVALKAAEIRRKWFLETGKKLKHGDALIAATAIIYGISLYSNNDRDFLYIKNNFGLTYINPIGSKEDLKKFKESLTE